MSSIFFARRELLSSLTPLENTVRFCLTNLVQVRLNNFMPLRSFLRVEIPKVRKVAFSETFVKRYPWSEGNVLLVVATG